MANNGYGGYFPTGYQPLYYPQYQTPQVQPQMQTQPVPQPQAAQPRGNNGLIWVQGETGAKSYLVAPNTTLLLMDSEGDQFYLKSADASGMPLPLRVFRYEEVTQSPKTPVEAPKNDAPINYPQYVEKSEYEAFKRHIEDILTASGGTETKTKAKKGASDDE